MPPEFETAFSGRIIQVTESLDMADAVSNQVVALDNMFKSLGLQSLIVSKWHHKDVAEFRYNFDDIEIRDNDIIVFHFCGYSEFAAPWVMEQYCTKGILYHNITPHHFFPKSSSLYEFCRKGRVQLRELIQKFNFFWADSQFNLEEIHALGIRKDRFAAVIPIIVSPISAISEGGTFSPGHWLFVGRIAPNKGQLELVRMFRDVRKQRPEAATKLTLIGGYNPNDEYYRKILTEIERLRIKDYVELTSKISDEDRERFFRTAEFYVALSEHEGFGVPLVEAPLRKLPVLALNRAASSETLGGHGILEDLNQIRRSLLDLSLNREARDQLVESQFANAQRFSPDAVKATLIEALAPLLPITNQYKTVSVVICTYNRRDYLERCLDYLQYQSNPNFEVIIVDGPSDDGTKEFIATLGDRIKITHNPVRNLSVSRNMGIELADGDIVAFIDDDAIPFDNWIDEILGAYNGRPLTTAGMGGPAFLAGSLHFQSEDIGINNKGRAWPNIPSDKIGKDGWLRSNLGTNATFVRKVLHEIDGFDEQFDYFLDESELCFRIQLKNMIIAYSPDILVRHEFAQSENRKSKYNYDWFKICKNTSYFVSAYSGLKSNLIELYLKNQYSAEREAPLKAALKNGEITPEQLEKASASIWAGMQQGLEDAKLWPRTRSLASPPGKFNTFKLKEEYSAVGRNIPPLHICVITRELPPFVPGGGIGTLYYHLIGELLLMGHKVSVVLPAPNDYVWRQGPLTLWHTAIPSNSIGELDDGFSQNLNWSLRAMERVVELHEEHRIDVVDSALWNAEALAFSMIEPSKRPPLVLRLVTPFSVAAEMNGWSIAPDAFDAFCTAERTLIAEADVVVPISEQIAKTIQKIHSINPDNKWKNIPCGITYWPLFDVEKNYDEISDLKDITAENISDSKIVLFLGRLERRKGIDIFIDSLSKILSSNEICRVVIAGSDPDNWKKKATEKLGKTLFSRVHFLGAVPDFLREKLLANAHCVVFPSRYESFGLVPLEAFVHGVPVIASESGAIPEVVRNDQCGLLFKDGDSEALSEAVIRLLRDDTLHQKLSAGARKRIHELSARNSARLSVEIYARLSGRSE